MLEIQSHLEERDREREEPLKDNEVAVLKEMCNVSLLTALHSDPGVMIISRSLI